VGDNTARSRRAKEATGALTWLFFVLCKVALVKITAALLQRQGECLPESCHPATERMRGATSTG